MFGRIVRAKREELLICAWVVFILLIIASSVVYFAEREAQPNAFGSIPKAMWWAVVTLTTIGYGDVYPITPLGKGLAAVVALLGIGLFAMPTAILAGAFIEEMHDRKAVAFACPHCGKEIDAKNRND